MSAPSLVTRYPFHGQRRPRLQRVPVLHHGHRHPLAGRQERRLREGVRPNVVQRRQGDRGARNRVRNSQVQDCDRRRRPASMKTVIFFTNL